MVEKLALYSGPEADNSWYWIDDGWIHNLGRQQLNNGWWRLNYGTVNVWIMGQEINNLIWAVDAKVWEGSGWIRVADDSVSKRWRLNLQRFYSWT